jgi:uncharacterized membrane protein
MRFVLFRFFRQRTTAIIIRIRSLHVGNIWASFIVCQCVTAPDALDQTSPHFDFELICHASLLDAKSQG